MTSNRQIFVSFTVEGIHRWPDAKDDVAFLAAPHRHIFNIRISYQEVSNDVAVTRDELLETAKSNFNDRDWGTNSCEQVASNLAEALVGKYKRTMTVEIGTTGNEFGAYVEFPYVC